MKGLLLLTVKVTAKRERPLASAKHMQVAAICLCYTKFPRLKKPNLAAATAASVLDIRADSSFNVTGIP